MKQIFSLILTALLLCTALAPSVLAAEEPTAPAETTDTVTDSGNGAVSGDSMDTATPSDADMGTDGDETGGTGDGVVPNNFYYTGSIISYAIPDAFTDTFNMNCGDTDFTQLHNELDSINISGTAQKEGSSYPLTLSVTWDFSTVDAETPGTYAVIGNISIPEGTTLADGFENTVSISVQVTAPLLNTTQSEKSSAAQKSAAVTESYSPTQTVISGLRLKDLCKEEESVVFGSGDVTVSIPSKLLLALNLSDADTLTVRLTQPESNQIVLAVEVSGKSVTQLSGTVLRLRYMPQSKHTDITIQNEAGEQITDVSFDGELLRFAADAAGTYTIIELSTTQETGKSTSPLLPVSGGLLLAVGGITYFWRRRH
ncbi:MULTISPECIES: hypothetical protein, partial [unclassified Oscillibacter]|uniref:hypothetical protein n=1 Tax=unclassified Oscillibacter TaxID=2629304 RepID=UPI0032E41BD8